jgi:hypothetical protein
LTFFQFLNADFCAVPEFDRVSIRVRMQRQLTERCRLARREMVSVLQRGRNSIEPELGTVRDADGTWLGLAGKHSFQDSNPVFRRRNWFQVFRRRESFRSRMETVDDQHFTFVSEPIFYAMKRIVTHAQLLLR